MELSAKHFIFPDKFKLFIATGNKIDQMGDEMPETNAKSETTTWSKQQNPGGVHIGDEKGPPTSV